LQEDQEEKYQKKRNRKVEEIKNENKEEKEDFFDDDKEDIIFKKMKKDENDLKPIQTIILTKQDEYKNRNLNEFLDCLQVLLSVKNQLSFEEMIIAENHIRNQLLTHQDDYKNSIKIKDELKESTFQEDFESYTKYFEDFTNNLDFES